MTAYLTELVSVRIPTYLADRLRSLDAPMSDTIRRAITKYLDQPNSAGQIGLSDHGTDDRPRWVTHWSLNNDPRHRYCCDDGHDNVEDAIHHGTERLTGDLLRAFDIAAHTPGTHAWNLTHSTRS